MNKDEILVPELKDWRQENGQGFSIDDWVACEGNISLAIGFSFIFWPDFLLHDGCVFIKSHFSADNYKNWLQTDYIENYGQIERVINHIHILDLFSQDKRENANYDQIKFLGNVLCDIYRVKLKAQYPDREFIVTFNGDEILEDFIDYEMTFHQVENDNRKK